MDKKDKKLFNKKQKKNKNEEVFYDSSTNDADLGLDNPSDDHNNDGKTVKFEESQSGSQNQTKNSMNSNANTSANTSGNANNTISSKSNYIPFEDEDDEEEEEFLFFNKKTGNSPVSSKRKKKQSSSSSSGKKKRLIITSNNIINPLSGISNILNPFKGITDKQHHGDQDVAAKNTHGDSVATTYQSSNSTTSGLFQLDTKYDSNYYNYYDYYIKELRWKKIWSWLCCCSFSCNILSFVIIAFLAITLSFFREPYFDIDQNQIAQLPIGIDLGMNTHVKGSNSNILPILIDFMTLNVIFMDPYSPLQVEINVGKVNLTKTDSGVPQTSTFLPPFGDIEVYSLESSTRPQDIPNLPLLLNLLGTQKYVMDIKISIQYRVFFFLVKSTTIKKMQKQRLY